MRGSVGHSLRLPIGGKEKFLLGVRGPQFRGSAGLYEKEGAGFEVTWKGKGGGTAETSSE